MSVSKTDALPLGYTPQKAKVLGYEYGSSRHAKSMDVHEAPAYRQRTVLQQAISVGYRIGRKAHRATVLQQSDSRGDVGVVSDGSITSIAACGYDRADGAGRSHLGPPPPRSLLQREIPPSGRGVRRHEAQTLVFRQTKQSSRGRPLL